MRDKNKNSDDLEYLANIGFGTTDVDEAEFDELISRVRKISGPGSSMARFYMVSFITGIFLAEIAFIGLHKPEQRHQEPLYKTNTSAKQLQAEIDSVPEINLETVNFVVENFTNSKAAKTRNLILDTLSKTGLLSDTIQVVNLQAIGVPENQAKSIEAAKLKFSVNSPILYIHDLKISDYKQLYFRRLFNSERSGIPAAYAAKPSADNENPRLKSKATIYLHEEMAHALFLFKAGKYGECIYSLSEIASYNKTDVNCSFYTGMCFFYIKNYVKALENFDICIAASNNAFYQEALFYKATTLAALGKKQEALLLFTQINDEGGFYQEKAKEFLEK